MKKCLRRKVRDIEPFSTAEWSERVENFLFRATREYTEAGIEQLTVAMRCLGANSPEPRGRAVPGLDTSALRREDTSALRAAEQQLYNRTALTWTHRGSLSMRRELVLSRSPTPPPFAHSRPPVSKVASCFFFFHGSRPVLQLNSSKMESQCVESWLEETSGSQKSDKLAKKEMT